jgi:outer membrane protein TolC
MVRESPRLTLSQAYQLALAISPRASERLARFRQEPTAGNASAASSSMIQEFSFSPLRNEVRQGELSHLLNEGGLLRDRLVHARQQAAGTGQRLVADWFELCLEVRIAYLEVLRARAQEQLARQSLTDAADGVKDSETRFEAGKVPRSDVLFAHVPENEASAELRRAASEVRGKLARLNSVLGLPVGAPLTLTEVELPEPLYVGADRLVLEAMALRPSARAVRYDLISEAYGPAVAEKDSSAQLMALATMAAMTDQKLAQISQGTNRGIDLRLPTAPNRRPQGGGRSQEKPKDLVPVLEEQRLRIEQEVRDAYRTADLTAEIYNLGLAQVATSQEAKSIASAQYRAGLVSISYLYQVQAEVWKAFRDQVNAFYDYLEDRARLDYARGVDPDPSTPGP